jgi:glycine betaine/proline transport system permease protein
MQTMPPFVYLIPAAIFFGLGKVPGSIATLIFAMPPAVRLTNLGIRQVSEEHVEAGKAFGCTSHQLLFKVQLPLAMPSIMAGINQTIMLALSMVVIASMIGAGGLGNTVLTGIQRLDVGLGFEGGLGVVLLAILLDRITQSFGTVGRGASSSLSARLRNAFDQWKASQADV